MSRVFDATSSRFRELLERRHSFPGPYEFKAFGPGSDAFHAAVKTVAEQRVGAGRVETSLRRTESGRHACVTLVVNIEHADEVVELYELIYRVDGLKMML